MGVWRLGDHQHTLDSQEADRHLGGHRRGAERTCGHGPVPLAVTGVVRNLLGRSPDDLDPIRPPEGGDDPSEKGRASPVDVQQRPLRLRERRRQEQPGHAPTTAQIKCRTVQRSQGQRKRRGRGDVGLERSGSEKAKSPGFGQGSEHRLLIVHDAYAGDTTTRRRGSSPSDDVETPSISFMASWMILRSAGLIGSRTTSVAL